jgi:Ca-activated chloride channel homolog
MVFAQFQHRLRALFVTLLAVALGTPAVHLDAQSGSIKTGVEMVPLTVTVTDTNGRYLGGLTGDDFTVLEDGVPQPLSFFAREEVPVDVALVLDTSASMRTDLSLIQSAAIGLVKRLRPADRGAVVEVKDSTGIRQPLTSDRGQIASAVQSLSASGSTALYDGLYVMLKEFDRERHASLEVRRQVLILLSDGLDNRSHVRFEDVMDLARRVGVNIYVIALRGDVALIPRAQLDGSILNAEYTMGTVARESGGRTFFPKTSRELPSIYSAIAEELACQYELGYVPVRPGGDGAFRRVLVRVLPSTNALARTRTGYYAARTRGGN